MKRMTDETLNDYRLTHTRSGCLSYLETNAIIDETIRARDAEKRLEECARSMKNADGNSIGEDIPMTPDELSQVEFYSTGAAMVSVNIVKRLLVTIKQFVLIPEMPECE